MIKIEPKVRNQIILFSSYFFLITLNTQCAKYFAYSNMLEWWINTAFMFACVLVLIFTFNRSLKILYKILTIPASWVVHAIFTIPAALALGILKYNPEQLRNAAEQRAVFILASLPIIYFVLKKSKIF